MPDASATTDHHRRMSCGVVSRLRAIRSSTRKDRSSRPRRGELPGIERNRPARRGPLPIGAREEIQAIRQLDRAMLAHEDHPRRSGSCSVIVKPYSRIGDEHMFASPSRAPAGRGTVWGLARKRAPTLPSSTAHLAFAALANPVTAEARGCWNGARRTAVSRDKRSLSQPAAWRGLAATGSRAGAVTPCPGSRSVFVGEQWQSWRRAWDTMRSPQAHPASHPRHGRRPRSP